MNRVMLVNMPWSGLHRPALGISLLKAALARDGVQADVRYFNLLWGERVSRQFIPADEPIGKTYAALSRGAKALMDQESNAWCLVDEWIFARNFFGEACRDPAAYVENHLRKEFVPHEV